MNEEISTEAGHVAALAVAGIGIQSAENGKPFVVVPDGFKVHDLEGVLDAPARSRGTITLRDEAAFIYTVNKFVGDATTIYRQIVPKPEFTAVFNDNTKEAPGWGDHVAHYACPLSNEWLTWVQNSGQPKNQQAFAEFIEKNLPDLVTLADADTGDVLVTPAQMLEVSRSLSAKKKVNFASGTRLDNGEIQFRYEEQIEGTVGKGDLKVPEMFKLGIPVFENGESYAVLARLRYRIESNGVLLMWFDLDRPHKIVEDAVKRLAEKITAETGLPTINGHRPPTTCSGRHDD